jgi:hypothetical protein
LRCAEMGTTTRSGGGARAPSASIATYAAAQATPPPPPLALPAPPVLHDHGSLRSMPFVFFAAISRPRGVMDRFSGFFAEEDDWATMADDCWDMMVARRRAVGTDRALVCGTTRRRARRKRSTNRAFVQAVGLTGVPWVKNFGTLRPERTVRFETAR